MTEVISKLLAPFPIHTRLTVIWGDMDAMQHVNNVVYFRYAETARFDYFNELGWSDVAPKGIGPILGSVSCRFRFPLTFPDQIVVGTRIVSVDQDRFTMKHLIVSERHQRIAAEIEGTIVAFDYSASQKAALPSSILERIRAIESRTPIE